MRGWKQGDMLLAEQESRDCFDFISDVGICGIICLWLLVLPNSNNLINHVLSVIFYGYQMKIEETRNLAFFGIYIKKNLEYFNFCGSRFFSLLTFQLEFAFRGF